MTMRKIMLLVLTVTLLGATAFSQVNLGKNNTNWKVYNGNYAAKSQPEGTGIWFPVHIYSTTYPTDFNTWFAIYLLANYNVSMTDAMTITAVANWTPSTLYKTATRTGATGAYVRLEFQDVTAGAYTSNDYWWYATSLDLNAVSSGTLTAQLSDRANWSNVCGQSATDTTPHPGPNCVGGTDPAVSPYDGFTHAMKSVKLVGLSFGNASSFASGIALQGSPGIFTLTTYTIQ